MTGSSSDGSPRDAIDAALAMLAALQRHNEARAAEGLAAIALGIGINTRPVTLGTVGGAKRFKCSVFGDSVNVAARIDQLTRRYETPLLVSAETLEHAGNGQVHDVPGSSTGCGWSGARARPPCTRSTTRTRSRAAKRRVDAEYRAGFAAYHQRQFAEELAAFERCRGVHDDTMLRIYAGRSRALLQSPPDDGWNGVETLNQK